MNKKLLLASMSLAMLTACTNDDFGSQNVAEETSPIQFEVINANEAGTRAEMDGNKVKFHAAQGDLFTLYHGGTCAADGDPLTAYQNATYKASLENGQAVLSTPSMIKQGSAIMTWPADTVFRATGGNLSIVIPQNQTDKIQYEIPYVSDLIDIKAYAAYSETADPGVIPTAYNTAGKDRKYSVYMRPMASQLNLKADYGTTENQIKELYEGAEGVDAGEGIDPIKVTSVELLTTPTGSTTPFTTEIPLTFTAQTLPVARWTSADANNAWSHVTGFGTPAGPVNKLTTKYLLAENKGCKFLILPQAPLVGGVADAGVVVNTIYGKVVIANPAGTNPHKTKYSDEEYANAWYRYLPATDVITTATAEENASSTTAETVDGVQLYKTVAKNLALGMQQTINFMSTYVAKASLPVVETEPIGVALSRYVNVNLAHLDMSDLHVKTDKQLRDAAKVWKKMGLDDVTVYLDGDATTGEFEISQKTIKAINDINASIAGGAKSFKVMPCNVTGEKCTDIVITGASDIQTLQDIAFIEAGDNGTKGDTSDDIKANVVLKNETTAWKWNIDATTKVGSIKVQASAVTRIINKGTILNDADATLKTLEKNGTQNNVPLRNDGKWNVDAGTLFVQFSVSNTNGGELTIKNGAEYRQDGGGHIFYNWANAKPSRFGGDDTQNGKVTNKGVFATVNGGKIYNYSLIMHDDKDAKTYISANDNGGAGFGTAFGAANKIGRINLPYSNKDEDNISVDAALNKGFVSVTVTAEELAAAGITSTSLDASVVGDKVNYIIVNSGITEISKVNANILYLEIADEKGNEIAWNVSDPTEYDGLIVLSKVNIKQGTTINVKKGNYLGATMYVGGTFKFNGAAVTKNSFKSYYGDMSDNFATMYVTY